MKYKNEISLCKKCERFFLSMSYLNKKLKHNSLVIKKIINMQKH